MIDQQNIIIEAIAKHMGVAPQDIDPEANLFEDLGIGPIEMSDLVGFSSNRFDITINPVDI